MDGFAFDVAHLLSGGLVLISLMLLYQDRLYSLLTMFAFHAVVLGLAVAWQAYIQAAPHLYVTAMIALLFKALVIPLALHRMVQRLGIHREIETVVGIGSTMLFGIGLVALSGDTLAVGAYTGPVLAAFGALHLSGQDGVLDLLARDGWVLERLPLGR